MDIFRGFDGGEADGGLWLLRLSVVRWLNLKKAFGTISGVRL